MDLLQELLPLFMRWTPEVAPLSSTTKLTLRQRAITTVSILFIYLLMCQIPLYGAFGRANDPFYQQRLILGSVKGTIMELGISPLLTSGLVAQLLSSTNLLPARLLTTVAGSSSSSSGRSKNDEGKHRRHTPIWISTAQPDIQANIHTHSCLPSPLLYLTLSLSY